MSARGGYAAATRRLRGGCTGARRAGQLANRAKCCRVRCGCCVLLRAPSAAYARDLMAPKQPYTTERLQRAASASADGARREHAVNLTCEYPSYLYYALPFRADTRAPRYRGVLNEEGGVDIEAPLRYDS